jgi:hypothetical protein
MSDEPKLTAEQLQQATARALPPDAALDAETTALRDSFLQFGRAVEAGNRDFDEAALLASLTATCLPAEPAASVAPTGKRETNWLPLVLTAALAASALLAIVRTVAVWPAADAVVTVQPQSPAIAKTPAPETNSIEDPALFAWSDPLDDEIASAQAAVENLLGRAGGLDGSLESFGSRLEALSAELDSGSL